MIIFPAFEKLLSVTRMCFLMYYVIIPHCTIPYIYEHAVHVPDTLEVDPSNLRHAAFTRDFLVYRCRSVPLHNLRASFGALLRGLLKAFAYSPVVAGHFARNRGRQR